MDFKTRILLYLVVLAILDMVIPIPFGALLMIYVVIEKPPWFREYTSKIYEN